MNNHWYAVRCCCEGTKVLGFIKLPRGGARQVVVERGDFSVAEGLELAASPFKEEMAIKSHVIQMRSFGNETAVYSDDKPIEFWRNIAGFVEAK